MNILYVTPFQPSLRSGGGRHCYANARALCLYPGAAVDYVGPEIENGLPDLAPEIFHRRLSRPFTLRDKVKAALRGASTSLISLFDEFIRQYDVTKYDLVFVETTRCGFVFPKLDYRTQTICSVHNVEADYLRFNKKRGTRLAARNIINSEQQTLNMCRMFLVMHNEDMRRLQSGYLTNNESIRFYQHPVCSPPPKEEPIPYEERGKNLIFAGSLDSKFNEMGLREFLLCCWPALKDIKYTLVVAGGKPSPKLVNFLLRQQNVRLISNPQEMEPILRNARILLLPDLMGTGMKLRVSEAMSLGVPVVGTMAGLRGYPEISRFGRAVESVEDMRDAVLDLLAEPALLSSYAKAAQAIWKDQYSLDIFTARLHRMLDDLFIGLRTK